ncbi:endonuclease domain-containing protein [Corynebacterium renale]|uniref:endonuclease domain-containing protein n=1 Tax=Corynebacterium renale TaxID=1724 RepID=UPI0015586ACC|nr:DUF559 domain-containing protein [Corynebacterium renale]
MQNIRPKRPLTYTKNIAILFDMGELFTRKEVKQSTKSIYALRKAVASGEVIRIMQGWYTKSCTTPLGLARELCRKIPDFVLAGDSAEQLFSGQELTFPIQGYVKHSRRAVSNEFVVTTRKRTVQSFTYNEVRVVTGYQKLIFDGHSSGVERLYSGRSGAQKMRLHQREHPRKRKRADTILKRYGADSGAELKVANLLRKLGFEPEHNYLIGGYAFDLVLPKKKIAIEINSWEFHSERGQFVADHVKGNEAVVRGWTVLRFSGSDVAHHLGYVSEILQEILKKRKRRFRPLVWRWHLGAN